VAGSCERGRKPSRSIKDGEFLDHQRKHKPLNKDSGRPRWSSG
jgi:hypothetical protein